MTKIEWTEKTCPCGMNTTTTSATQRRTTSEWSPFAHGVTPLGKRVERWFPGATDDALTTPLRRRAGRHVVLCCDLFHEDFKEWWIYLVLAVMGLTHNTATTDENNVITSRRQRHTYQVLTQRSSRMRNFMNALAAFLAAKPSTDEFVSHPFTKASQQVSRAFGHPVWMNAPFSTWPWISDGCPGLWLGVSAERQQEADERIPDLLATPAAVRFVSCEPLLGAIDLTWIAARGPAHDCYGVDALRGMPMTHGIGSLDWVICGGESGPDARPMHPDWARSLRDQCAAAGVPFFFKQVGAWEDQGPAWGTAACDEHEVADDWLYLDADGTMHRRRDNAARCARAVHRVGKARAGRLLDGVLHDAMPSR